MPLEGIRVLDFTWIELGPVCTQVLGDFGADIVKIERIERGDPSREHLFPCDGDDPVYLSLNRNKRSIAIDLKTSAGHEIAQRLASESDVLVENFRPGVMERLHLSYDELRRDNPRLIYARGSGFGDRGPLREKAGMDTLAQSASGLMIANGEQGIPRKVGSPVADYTAGLLLAQGILLAILSRERSGEGQLVTTSLLEGMVASQLEGVYWLNTGRRLNWGAFPVDGPFPTSDGYITVVDAFRPRLGELCAVLEIDDLSADPRFSSAAAALANRHALDETLAAAFSTRTTTEWLDRLEAIDFLCAPVLTPEEALEHPQVKENDMIWSLHDGSQRTIGQPIKLNKTPAVLRRNPPRLGIDTRPILEAAGYSTAEIDRLEATGVIGTASAGVAA